MEGEDGGTLNVSLVELQRGTVAFSQPVPLNTPAAQ